MIWNCECGKHAPVATPLEPRRINPQYWMLGIFCICSSAARRTSSSISVAYLTSFNLEIRQKCGSEKATGWDQQYAQRRRIVSEDIRLLCLSAKDPDFLNVWSWRQALCVIEQILKNWQPILYVMLIQGWNMPAPNPGSHITGGPLRTQRPGCLIAWLDEDLLHLQTPARRRINIALNSHCYRL